MIILLEALENHYRLITTIVTVAEVSSGRVTKDVRRRLFVLRVCPEEKEAKVKEKHDSKLRCNPSCLHLDYERKQRFNPIHRSTTCSLFLESSPHVIYPSVTHFDYFANDYLLQRASHTLQSASSRMLIRSWQMSPTLWPQLTTACIIWHGDSEKSIFAVFIKEMTRQGAFKALPRTS